MFEDNQGALQLVQNPVTNPDSKHIAIRHQVFRELVHRGNVSVAHVLSEHRRADILTKALVSDVFVANQNYLMSLSDCGFKTILSLKFECMVCDLIRIEVERCVCVRERESVREKIHACLCVCKGDNVCMCVTCLFCGIKLQLGAGSEAGWTLLWWRVFGSSHIMEQGG